jgi:hypothetical protein
MITGAIKSQIDQIWNAFWSGGISNPLEVIEQITYLLFLRRLDDLHTLEENKSARLKEPMARRVNRMTEHGVMEAARLYESPFTDLIPQGPETLFTVAEVDDLIALLASVRATAVAA